MNLSRVITAKIVVTVLFWCVPLLLGPKALFDWVGVPWPEPSVFVRLLGAAYLALVVAYYHGLLEVRSGKTAPATVRMGVVSNGAAAIILGIYGIKGTWADWPPLAQAYMWASLGVASLIAIGLIATGWNQLVASADLSNNTARTSESRR
jgi:hypothetical protein